MIFGMKSTKNTVSSSYPRLPYVLPPQTRYKNHNATIRGLGDF